ncbi:septal ring lytic transglycosylase RlpA family protein [Methylobacter sp. S3L5C]|nr:septal ring lytic transglycosylase RlpA family protein [Methylobacter sp. S3L5C]UOA10769.1 septal ring lytic transglycosylase RlpA family protein [Methylobacter sp. S3L5C]
MPYPSCFYKAKYPLPTGFLVGLMLLSSLLSGCASEPTLSESQATTPQTSRHNSSGHKAAYNRPYKVKGKTYYPMPSAAGYSEQGLASWYGYESGNRTAMGTRFKPKKYTAAHKTLPLPSKVRVTNLRNGRSIIVLVNDRGPFKKNRLIDLSQGAAKKIGVHGVANVKIEYIGNLAEND